MALLILRYSTIETERGATCAAGFLMDMYRVFQDFVTKAIREALGVSERTFRADSSTRRLTLDEGRRVQLKPDLSWWDGPDCTFVGDAKYKRVVDERAPSADLYQLLAYATALDLPGGLLVYAQGEANDVVHRVRHSGKRLEIVALDLSESIQNLRERVQELAERVRSMRDEGRRHRIHAA